MLSITKRVALLLAMAIATACGTDTRPPDAPTTDGEPTLTAIRGEIFNKSCTFASCHGASPAAHLELRGDGLCNALVVHTSCLFPRKMLVVPGKPELSFLLDKLAGTDLDDEPSGDCAASNQRMPFGSPALPADKIAQVEQWIRAGASCDVAIDAGVPDIDAHQGPPSDVAAISANATTIQAGAQAHVTVTLAKPAPAGGQTLDLDVGDATVLGVPSALNIDAGQSTIEFDVIGKRPARRMSLTASSGTNSKSVSIAVTGLALAEIAFDLPSLDDGYEWIKLSNTTNVAIDLAPYSLGSGRTSYTYSIAQLSGTIPAHGCFVIGGSISAAGNGNPVYAQTFNFSPDLVNGSGTNGQAAGFGLFDVPTTQLVPSTVPLDAVLCGQNNLAGLKDASGVAATPHCPDVAAGHSVARSTATMWIDKSTLSPNACP